jgi:hypothetical protein
MLARVVRDLSRTSRRPLRRCSRRSPRPAQSTPTRAATPVFLHVNREGRAVGTELRGTTHIQWRGMAAGSHKAAGYFAAGSERCSEIVLCESAIDAVSCHALRPAVRALSTAGTCSIRGWLPDLLASARTVWCGFDSDQPGEDAVRAMIARHPTITRLRPLSHDWNDDLKARRAALRT